MSTNTTPSAFDGRLDSFDPLDRPTGLCWGQDDPLEFTHLSERELEDIRRKLSRDLDARNLRSPFRLYTAGGRYDGYSSTNDEDTRERHR